MEHSVPLLSSALGKGKMNRVVDHLIHVDAGARFEANKHRRKVQNRKNQRAHRLRNREPTAGSARASRPFQVSRWHLDEPDEYPSRDASSGLKATSPICISLQRPRTYVRTSTCTPKHAGILQVRPPTATVHAQTALTPPLVIFPLSTDHLLHLIQYNVFRAFVSNKRTLNTLLTGWTESPLSPTTCPISGPYRDDTSVYPLNPNIPLALVPTRLQQTHLHSLWINLFPFPSLRDNLIRHEGNFDHWELLQDIIGELMGMTPARERRGIPVTITVSDPKPKWTMPLSPEHDEDEMTAGRNGFIVWGEPYDMHNWEATPGFLEKWSWAVIGCHDLIESTNRWRLMRGEEPVRLFKSKW